LRIFFGAAGGSAYGAAGGSAYGSAGLGLMAQIWRAWMALVVYLWSAWVRVVQQFRIFRRRVLFTSVSD
jgi:hypothetical protein